MQNKFNKALSMYIDDEKLVNSSKEYFSIIVNELPNMLQNFINDNKFKITGSIGQGNKSHYPWIAILNKTITKSAHSGIYIVYLFKKDMSGFYLSLNQGITYFIEKYGDNRSMIAHVENISRELRDEIASVYFDNTPISLGSIKKDRSTGYEAGNIISKYYAINKFTSKELEDDLLKMIAIYDNIYTKFNNNTYDTYIDSLLDDLIPVEEALNVIEELTDDKETKKKLENVTPQYKDDFKPTLGSNLLRNKKDYENENRKNSRTGLSGEALVLEFEKERLEELGRIDLAKRVKWVSQESDDYGYDVQSFDVDESGKITKKYIEVKTSKGNTDGVFYISPNELDKSEEFGEEYVLFRIYDIDSTKPKYYEIRGNLKEKLNLKPQSYVATIRKEGV